MTFSSYAAPELLAKTEWLYDHLGDSRVRVVDMGWDGEFDRAHIPGAVRIPHPYIKSAQKERPESGIGGDAAGGEGPVRVPRRR